MVLAEFTEKDFRTFEIEGLEERMEAIRSNIQPKFKRIGDKLAEDMTDITGQNMYIHIARHARRTKNPPNDTWMAFCHDKRGYKKHPHFQIGLWHDHLFIWLAYIYELSDKDEIAESFQNHIRDIRQKVPDDYVISQDHTKNSAADLANIDLEQALHRFKTVKKAEFLIGKHYKPDDPRLKDEQTFLNEAKHIFKTLLPLYQLSVE